MSLEQFLQWLVTAAGSTAALSFVAERVPAFQRLSSDGKQAVHLIGSILLALGSWAILTYVPPDLLAQLSAPFAVVAGVFAAWVSNQLAHKLDPANK